MWNVSECLCSGLLITYSRYAVFRLNTKCSGALRKQCNLLSVPASPCLPPARLVHVACQELPSKTAAISPSKDGWPRIKAGPVRSLDPSAVLFAKGSERLAWGRDGGCVWHCL